MFDDSTEEVLDAEFARVEAIDAGLDAVHQMTRGGVLRVLIEEAREKAIDALQALVRADPEDAKTIRELQWQVTRYDDLCRWIKDIAEDARNKSEDITAEQAASLARLIKGDEADLEDA